MKRLSVNEAGYFSVETLIVVFSVVLFISFMLSFVIGVFSGIDELCSAGVEYKGFLPATIHRVTNVIIETGGELIGQIS